MRGSPSSQHGMAMGGVLFYVQHLIGVGHLKRAARVAGAIHAAGLPVTLVSGGFPVPGMELAGVAFQQLPPARAADESFRVLVGEGGRPVDDAWRARRRELLERLFSEAAPRVLMVEMFPFGRRHFRFELLPLLERAVAAAPRPWVVCSVRDILVQPPFPERYAEMAGLAERFFDQVLVHGDPALIPFARTFPLAERLAGRLQYTGYVAEGPPAPAAGPARREEVLVAGGSRGMGEPLLNAALEARALTSLAGMPWRLLAGHHLPAEALRRLQHRAPAGTVVEAFRPDFPALLAGARLCICQGGYNTTLEALAAGVPTVVAPHAEERDGEQGLRARLLAERGLLATVPEGEPLTPGALAEAVERALALDPPAAGGAGIRLNGARETARLVAALAGRPWAAPAP